MIRCIAWLRAAKLKQMAIIPVEIEPMMAPKKAPTPVVMPDSTT